MTQTFTQAPIATTTLPTSTELPPLDKTVAVDTSEPYSATVSFNRAFHDDLRYVPVVIVLVLLPIYIYGVSMSMVYLLSMVYLCLWCIYVYGVSIVYGVFTVYGVSMSMVYLLSMVYLRSMLRSQTIDTHRLIALFCIVRN